MKKINLELKISKKELKKKLDVKDGEDGKDGSPDTGAEIVRKINELPQNPRVMIDASHIKNLSLAFKGSGSASGGGGSGSATIFPGGTAGSILFVNPDNVIAQDNARLFWDDANAKMGINTNSSLLATLTIQEKSGNTVNLALNAPTLSSNSWIVISGITNRGLIYTGGGAVDFGLGTAIGSPTINGTNQIRIDSNNARIGIGTTSPLYAISFNGLFAQTIGIHRHPTANTAGNILTVRSGDATTGATNKNGGDLMLQGGISTGSGTSNVLLQAYPGIAASTTDNTPVTVATGSAVGATAVPTLIMAGVMRLKGYTVATLPAGTQGDTAFVTDALAPTFLATIVGGGTVVTPVFYNGTNWVGY